MKLTPLHCSSLVYMLQFVFKQCEVLVTSLKFVLLDFLQYPWTCPFIITIVATVLLAIESFRHAYSM